MNKAIVLIPAYDEAKGIGPIVKKAREAGHKVYVIDDGSTDGTAAVAAAAGAAIVVNRKNMGKGASIRIGIEAVLKTDFDSVVIMDGDGQHEVSSIADFVKCMEDKGCDIVIGNRMNDTKGMPYIRKMTNVFMSNLISKTCGQQIPDTQCGFRLIKKKVFEDISIDTANFEIESEIIIKAAKAGFKICSVPISTVYGDEKSKINPILDTIRFAAFMFKIKFAKEKR
jgi:glycosyltransferase involved in cell wall biosynthesis